MPIQYTLVLLGDVGNSDPRGRSGSSSESTTTLNAASLMNLVCTSTQLAQLFNILADGLKNLNFLNRSQSRQNSMKAASRFLDKFSRLSNRTRQKIKSDRSRMYPARSCRDSADYYPEKPNGLNDYHDLLFVPFCSQDSTLSIQMKVQKTVLCLFIVNLLNDWHALM